MSKQESRVNLTAGRVESFTCPAGKAQAFLWDTDTPTLAELILEMVGHRAVGSDAKITSLAKPCDQARDTGLGG